MPIRVGVRPGQVAEASGATTFIDFDFLDPDSYRDAVAGCDAVFLLRPPAIANTRSTLNRFIDVARAEGVRQIVFISVAGAATNPFVLHYAVETHLRTGPPGWTILRPGFFMQNLGGACLRDIRDDDRIYVPADDAHVAFVDTRDIAAVAVDALVDPLVHAGQVYNLTGSTALSFDEVATLLSATLGRSITYRRAGIAGYLVHSLDAGFPLVQALVQTILHVGLRFGQAATIDPTLARLLGHEPLAMDAYVRDVGQLWLRPQAE